MMVLLDAVNTSMGAGTLHFAATGFTKVMQMKQLQMSQLQQQKMQLQMKQQNIMNMNNMKQMMNMNNMNRRADVSADNRNLRTNKTSPIIPTVYMNKVFKMM